MTPPVWLIAEREFRAYVATLSFWVALAVGPLALAGALGLFMLAARPPPAAVRVSIQAPSADAWRAAAAAVSEAARLEGHTLVVLPRSDRSGAARVMLPQDGGARLDMAVAGPLPLSPAGRMLVLRTLERDAALHRLGEPPPVASAVSADAGRPEEGEAAALALSRTAARFGLVMMLWLTLTGSLGMLLQAVVRERANRALESLLAAARPVDVVAGKVAGVGAVSLLVLAIWLAAAGALAALVPAGGRVSAALGTCLASPAALARAALVYVLAFGFYGLVTVALGAGARDSAQAQNLSRPMFAVLLAAFFAALVAAGGASQALGWLLYAPPFTPFMLLLAPPGSLGAPAEVIALGLLCAAMLIAGKIAVRRLDLIPAA
jgi:ABC-2 type transport system permease protein